jgi:hypothetical protein
VAVDNFMYVFKVNWKVLAEKVERRGAPEGI